MAQKLTHSDLLRMGQAEIKDLLDDLDQRIPSDAEMMLRKHERYPYHVQEGLVAWFEQSSPADKKFVVRPRNISGGGIAFLHGVFVYPGTKCKIALKTRDGERVVVAGSVVGVRCIVGRAHEVRVRFTNEVDVSDFVYIPGVREGGLEGTEYCVAELSAEVEILANSVRCGAPVTTIRVLLDRINNLLAKGSGEAEEGDDAVETEDAGKVEEPVAAGRDSEVHE